MVDVAVDVVAAAAGGRCRERGTRFDPDRARRAGARRQQALEGWGPKVIDESTFDDLIGAAARVVAVRSDNPIAYCHAVTAPAAVRMILPHLPPQHVPATLAACWQMAASLIAAFADPPHPDETLPAQAPPPDPGELAQLALGHGDEHVIKLTEACLRQYAVTSDTTLLIAADRFRSRIDPLW
jgi:Questin oxidase-like